MQVTSKTKKQPQTPKYRRNKRYLIIGLALGAVLLLVLLLQLWRTGQLQYAFAYVRCGGQPVEAIDFAASYTYILPTDEGYGPGLFNKYYCAEQEAQAAGFRHSSLTTAGRQEAEEQAEAQEDRRRFDKTRLDYVAYVPSLTSFTYTTPEFSYNPEWTDIFYYIKRQGVRVADVREGRVGSGYELCVSTKYTCKSIGTDSQGRDIKRQYPAIASDRMQFTARIGTTFVNITDTRQGFTTEDAIALFGSMKEIK